MYFWLSPEVSSRDTIISQRALAQELIMFKVITEASQICDDSIQLLQTWLVL